MQDSIPRHDFYVYALYRNGIPFYVGKGCKKRMEQHEYCARKRESCRHIPCRVIRKAWRDGEQISKEKVCEDVSEASAFRVEKLMITCGRAYNWPLVNLSNGGDSGPTGTKRTPEQLAAQSHRTRERMLNDPVQCNRIGNMYRGRKLTPEENEIFHQKLKHVYASSPEKVERQRQHQLQRWANNPQERERYRQMFEDSGRRSQAGTANIGNTYHARSYVGFVSPCGVVYKDIHNLKAFCQEHNLSASHLYSVASGKRRSHQGWIRHEPDLD